MEDHDLQAPARFQFRLRTLMIVTFLVALFFSAAATLGNVVLGCGLTVPIGLVVGAIVGGACRRPWQGMTGGVAGAFYANVPTALLAVALTPLVGDVELALTFFPFSSLVGALPGAIVGIRAQGGIGTSVKTGMATFTAMALVCVVGGWASAVLSGGPVGDHFFPLLLMVLIDGPPIGAVFGALYWFFDERVRKRQGLMEQRSDAGQLRADLSADDHGPGEVLVDE